MNRYIFVEVIMTLVLSLSACAPIPVATPRPIEGCARTDIAGKVVDMLNAKAGQIFGPRDHVISMDGLVDWKPRLSDNVRGFNCHTTLNLANGKTESGIATVTLDYPLRDVRSVDWRTDATLEKQQAEQDDAIKNQDWHNFHGNIATWTGIPPLPASASSKKTAKSNANCTVSDVTGNTVEIWTSISDCNKWIKQATELDKKGPTLLQWESYKRDKCIQELSARMVQSYSGEFFEICSGVGAHY